MRRRPDQPSHEGAHAHFVVRRSATCAPLQALRRAAGGLLTRPGRVPSGRRFAAPFKQSIPDQKTDSAAGFLKRPSDRTLRAGRRRARGAGHGGAEPHIQELALGRPTGPGLQRRPRCGRQSEKDAKLAQKLGQLQPFLAVFHRHYGPTCIFWANLTPFSLKEARFTTDVERCRTWINQVFEKADMSDIVEEAGLDYETNKGYQKIVSVAIVSHVNWYCSWILLLGPLSATLPCCRCLDI